MLPYSAKVRSPEQMSFSLDFGFQFQFLELIAIIIKNCSYWSQITVNQSINQHWTDVKVGQRKLEKISLNLDTKNSTYRGLISNNVTLCFFAAKRRRQAPAMNKRVTANFILARISYKNGCWFLCRYLISTIQTTMARNKIINFYFMSSNRNLSKIPEVKLEKKIFTECTKFETLIKKIYKMFKCLFLCLLAPYLMFKK